MTDITKTKDEKLYDLTLAVYICQILSIFLGVTAIVGIVINYIKREEVKGTWLESHFNWQIRTFWFALLWFVIGIVLMMIFIGMFVLVADLVWFIYRAVKGLLLFLDEKPIFYAPHDSADDPKNNIKEKEAD